MTGQVDLKRRAGTRFDQIVDTGRTPSGMPQRMQALERANEIRLARAALKRKIAAGEITTARVLLERPPEAMSWPVADLIMAQRRWGRSRTLKLLGRAGHIAEMKPVGHLTDRQRRQLATMLGERTAAGEGEE